MRIGKVIGTVTLNRQHPGYQGARLRMVVPYSHGALMGQDVPGDDFIVVWDQLGAGIGDLIAISEGPEASMPFRPEVKCVDAYNAAIIDHLEIAGGRS